MSEDDLEAWAVSNREELTLSFLGYLAEEESASVGHDQNRLWELGSKLMALREGFTPVTAVQLNEEVAAAAADVQQAALVQEDRENKEKESAAVAVAVDQGLLTDAVRRNAALGLSFQGMELLEQQAAALEATMGAQRAQSLTEIIGRKKLMVPEEASSLFSVADAAARILEVLVQIENREERAAVLPDAFSPPIKSQRGAPTVSSEEEEMDDDDDEGEEFLYTSPLQLLQSVDLWLHRVEVAAESGSGGAAPMLNGAVLGMSSDRLVGVLQELREDILGVWDSTSGDDF